MQSLFYDGTQTSIIPDSLAGKNAYMWTTEFFTDILNDAKQRLPADKYILILSGHGDGYTLFGDGEFPIASKTVPQGMDNMPGLALAQIKEGIENSNITPSELQMIYLDACLMSGMEYGAELAGLSQYMLANPTTTPGIGGNYQDLVNLLKNGALNDNTTFESQIKIYMDDMVNNSGELWWNNSYSQNTMIMFTRLFNMPNVTAALGEYMSEFVNLRNGLQVEAQASLDTLILQSTFNYSLTLSDQTSQGTVDAFYPVYDIASCLYSINTLIGSTNLLSLYDDFIDARNQALVYYAHTPTFEQNTSSSYWISGYGDNVIQSGVPYSWSVSLIWSGAYTNYAPKSQANYQTLQVCKVGNLNEWLRILWC